MGKNITHSSIAIFTKPMSFVMPGNTIQTTTSNRGIRLKRTLCHLQNTAISLSA